MVQSKNAEIAQLVEHNLAKVGVASSSLVFRSSIFAIINAQVADLVDAHVSGACAARRAGSSPVLGTIQSRFHLDMNLLLITNKEWRGGGMVDALL